MAYGVKYRIEYKDSAGVDKKLDIEERDFVGARTDCAACEDPLNIEIPAFKKFVPVVSTGCSVNAESASNMQFLGLYTIDPQKVRLRCYAGAASVPFWSGYGNPEVYGEPYSRAINYDVALYFNDGFATLERYKYLNGTAKYDTLETMWNVLVRIINKMGLSFEYLYFACRHSCNGIYPGTSETLWHNLKIDQLNYYDENDKPMTYLQVLEALLTPFGLQIRWHNGSILISEAQMMFDANFSAKRYNSSFTYVDTVTLALNFNITNGDINWDNEDQVLDKIGGYSRQKIRYSPYIIPTLIKNKDLTNRFMWSGSEAWSLDGYGVARLTGISAVTGYTMGTNVSFTGHKKNFLDPEQDIYFEKAIPNNSSGVMITTTGIANAAAMSGQLMKIAGEVYIRSIPHEYSTNLKTTVARIEIPCTVEIDGKGPYIDIYGTWQWSNGYTLCTSAFVYLEDTEVTLCDRWVKFEAWVPPGMPGGTVVCKIFTPMLFAQLNGGSRIMGNSWSVGRYRVRLTDLTCVKADTQYTGSSLISVTNIKELAGDDVSYEGTLNEDFINEADEITFLHSDAVNMTDRGAIRKLDGSVTSAWQKGSGTSYRLADILLRMIISQYKDSMTTLNGTLEANALMGSNGGPVFLFTLQDTANLSSAKLLFAGGTYNDFYRTLNGNYEEVKEDSIGVAIV
jgi:hypothetical protein